MNQQCRHQKGECEYHIRIQDFDAIVPSFTFVAHDDWWSLLKSDSSMLECREKRG